MRLTELQREDLSERQREIYERIVKGPRQSLNGPFIAWLRSPELADRAESLGHYLRFESNLTSDIKELAILMVARNWQATFVWESHRSLASDAGLSDKHLDTLREGGVPSFTDAQQSAAYQFLIELLEAKRVSSKAWESALDSFGEQGVVDLLGVVGYYTMVVLTVVATELGEDLPDSFGAHGRQTSPTDSAASVEASLPYKESNPAMNFANICGHYVHLDAIAYYVARAGGGVTIHFAGGIKELILPNASVGDVCAAIQKAKTEPNCAAVQTLSDTGRFAQ